MEKRGNTGYAEAWLRRMGYQPDTRMQGMVGVWFGWFAANNGWYHYSERRGFRVYKRERASLHPAALVADEWASLLMNESTIISSTSDERRAWMARYFANPTTTGGDGQEATEGNAPAQQPTEDSGAPSSFAMDNADFIARAFAMGTGAWVIEPRGVTDSAYTPDAELRIVRYDATQIVPLTWSADDCTQCAFVGRVEVAGRDYDQCQAHVLKGGTYHILTQLFDTRTHKQVTVEGISADMDTRCTRPLFALVRPAVSNRFYDYCAMGASVYCNAVGAMKVVDEAATSLLDHIRVGRPRTFVDKTLIESKTDKGPDGSLTKTYYAFGEADDTIFSMNPGDEGSAKIQTVQSDLKADENASAINTGLRLLSVACGFGNGYFSWESHTGLKTAKEVAADNSQLMRSIHRHENALRKSIVRLVNGMADACRSIRGEAVPYGDVTVDFDDSIISDTQSARDGHERGRRGHHGPVGVPPPLLRRDQQRGQGQRARAAGRRVRHAGRRARLMLGPDYIEHFTDAAQGAMDEYTLRLVCIYAALIGSIDFEGDSAYSQAARRAALAAKDVQKAMNDEGRRAAREAAKAAAEAVAKSAEADLATLGTAMGALSKAMQWRLHNSARATAAGVQDVVSRDNLKMPANVQRAYLEVVAQAVARVNSGMAGYEQATREAVLKLARRGVSVVDYKSGAWAQADVAMRRHIRTQAVQAGSRNTLELLEETGNDLVQTSSHGGARESHAKWQGRVFSLSGKSKKYPPFYRETGYGSVDGLCGANCKHDFGIYVEGQPLRYERDPDGGDEKREKRYQASQQQRAIEREVRTTRREAAALEAAGIDNTKERIKLSRLQQKRRDLVTKYPHLNAEHGRENPYETGSKVYALTRQKVSRTAYMAHPNTKALIAEAGVSQKRVGELVKASGDGFELKTAAERRAALDNAIKRAKAEKERDRRVANAAAMEVHADKQAKHIAGSRQHEQYVANLKRKGGAYKEPSGITVPLEEVRDLIAKHAGTGTAQTTRSGKWSGRETCDAGRVIGYVIGDNGEHIPTTRFTIHYADGDVHIVPTKPEEAQQ